MKHTDTRGFTLIELLVVVLIIGILASIAVPQYKLAVHKARIRSYLPVIRELKEAQELYYTVNNRYAGSNQKEELDVNFPKECKQISSSQNWRLSCNNHVTLTTFGQDRNDGLPVAVGMIYCYNGSQPCGDNYDLQILKVFEYQHAASSLVGQEGKWGCFRKRTDDTFGQKLCQTVNKS